MNDLVVRELIYRGGKEMNQTWDTVAYTRDQICSYEEMENKVWDDYDSSVERVPVCHCNIAMIYILLIQLRD